MFKPHYIITDKLLFHVKRVNTIVLELNNRKFPKVVLYELERIANVISSHASTSIEGNPLPLTEVKKLIKSNPKNLAASEREVINYNRVLDRLNQRLNKRPISLSLDFILSVHREVVDKLVPVYQLGKLRQEAVFVNDPKLRKTVYWPPDAEDVPRLMKELVSFTAANRGKVDPLIIAGIFHKQFVIIHPFTDGNGRTARLITKALLADMGLDTFNLFSFENYYNQNVSNYFKNVGVYGNYYDITDTIDFTNWLEYFTEGLIAELIRVKKLLPQIATSPETELKPYHKKILSHVEEKGYITDRDYAGMTDRAKPTRNLDFNKLIKMGLLKRKGKGRATYYRKPPSDHNKLQTDTGN